MPDKRDHSPRAKSPYGSMSVSTGEAVYRGPICSFIRCFCEVIMTEKRIWSMAWLLRIASLAVVAMSWQMPETSWSVICSAVSMMSQTAEVQAKGHFQFCLIESTLLRLTRTPLRWPACESRSRSFRRMCLHKTWFVAFGAWDVCHVS